MNVWTLVVILILAGMLVVWLAARKVQKQKAELDQKTAQIRKAAEQVEEVKIVQQEINQVETKADKPVQISPAASGDSASRLDRLNRL